jgi:type IV fimbrial biogenesis protein FimT
MARPVGDFMTLSLPLRKCGFTLIEMIVVIAIALVLMTLVAPSFRDLMRSQTVKNASFDLVSSLVRARSEAITRNADVIVRPLNGDWINGWEIVLTDGTRLAQSDARSGITVTGPTSITFNGNGKPTAIPNPFALSATDLSAGNQRCVRLNLSGRPQLKKGACA